MAEIVTRADPEMRRLQRLLARVLAEEHYPHARVVGGELDGRCHALLKLGGAFARMGRSVRCTHPAIDEQDYFCGYHDHWFASISVAFGETDEIDRFLASRGLRIEWPDTTTTSIERGWCENGAVPQ